MSDTSTGTVYNYYVEVDSPVASVMVGFTLSTGAESNDALALELANAIRGVSWPEGAPLYVQLSKAVVNETLTTASGTPIVFPPDGE